MYRILCWEDREEVREKVLITLSVSKINDSTNFKGNFGNTPVRNYTRRKKVNTW